MERYEDTAMTIEQLGTRYPDYRPTHRFPGEYVDRHQARLVRTPLGRKALMRVPLWPRPAEVIASGVRDALTEARNLLRFGFSVPGWLLRAEALKLYEMAFFAPGDVLELGCYHGLSTSVLAQAVQQSPVRKALLSSDIDPACVIATWRTLRARGLAQGVSITCQAATDLLAGLAARGQRFAMVFVDHSHAYEDVLATCRALPGVVSPGGFCLFHDYNNPANRDAANHAYGVYQAVHQGLDRQQFGFYGVFGSMSMFRAEP